ncbi:MAG: hypothetical protein ACJ8FT_08080 [Sphingomonas sp.]
MTDRIETSAERAASALFAGAAGYACYALLGPLLLQPALAACAAGLLAYLPCSRVLNAAAERTPHFHLAAFELRELGAFEPDDELLLTDADRLGGADELVLTDADRLELNAPLILDDILAEIGPDARVVRLFDRRGMPTAGQLQSRIDSHLGKASSVDPPEDASHALSAALAELRRSLR